MMQRNLMAMALIGAIATTLVTTAHAQSVLSADVIKQSFAGNSAEFPNGLVVYWAPDGTQRLSNPSGSTDVGTWRITPEGDFCGKWAKLRNGAEACAPVIDVGGGQYQWGASKFRVVLGNPRGL